MTRDSSSQEADWKLVVRGLKERGTSKARALIEKTILEAGGVPLPIREARRRLFILTTSASSGRPAVIEAEGGLVCLISIDDLVEIVMEKGPTLAEVIDKARFRQGGGDAR